MCTPRILVLVALPLMLAARTPKGTQTAPEQVTPTGPTKTTSTTAEGMVEVKVDLNNDGVVEIINYYRQTTPETRLLMRKDMDLNRDGRVDISSTFNEAGRLVQEQMDSDFDGKVDWIDEYGDGRRTVTKVDTDFNGTFDMVKYFENGMVRRKERDTNADGKVDFWEYLDERGNVIQTGQDIDGDGKMDVRQE